MNKIRKTVWVIFSLIGFLAVSFPGYAVDGSEDKGPSRLEEKKQNLMNEIIDGLGLTDEQKQKIQEHHEQMSTRREKFSTEGKAKREELKKELEKPDIDRAKIDQLVAEISAQQTERLKDRVEGVLAIRSILTPEQFAQMNQKIEAKREAFMKMHKDYQGKMGHAGEGAPVLPPPGDE